MEAECPYCKKKLPKMPKRKSNCPFCGEAMWLLREPGMQIKLLMTAERAKEVLEAWAQVYKRTLKQKVEWLGVTDKSIEEIKNELREKFKTEPGEHDIIWRIYNEELLKATDYQDKKIIYYYMARELNEEKLDARNVLEYMHECDLRKIMQAEIKKVEVRTFIDDRCEKCKSINGIVMDINEALTSKFLPHKDCEYFEDDSPYPLCRAMYVSHFDD